ncbi:2-octaprenyl-3-methyl-6-methoxy-1,4-benzoquinol hydroxylase [Candidatus Rickettsiella isopodorum]|jgi:3-demethoxyubiquinol 3-hydroxylase|uniref:3-demethoxyubiquinol 3-hydroxylase n=1 Tax=Candidatus Rickettsiella isopodorum TaxID=1225476 RepID=A0A1J8PKV7_9COXI|nr:2-polyprenyl-3-methyl-6-methoxy-1,4-benzoquinone monooxygenase [Candidatus Rickettsiella isopodorum]MCH9755014.1 2-polyprenyl-3-methyl-6-methoxy-1,4-benzoquinone monooxygenase [Gammaproteobacteria bacterium]MDQ5899378.1 3-demethoxyubiquinol 3-hydroxylase [Pseudomonadota bacterium]MDD4893532.1 2-polyprenyl-3-methyl-6-methoxy-1,4-benzoquinone monooxygenase [Candidatus Rickettsiella isopodorum]MDD5161324.1 2-polyprenyl-3-methyl-6-methoxy-1,4-benzoquinone monooxygenase [Candidatus Rickettsiella 
MRDYSFWDQLILQFDEALGSIPLLSAATRPNPAENLLIQDNVLSKKENQLSGSLMRINHVGEVCAQALYTGQALTARSKIIKQKLKKAAGEEVDHLNWCRQRIHELDTHVSYLNPFWYISALLMGLIAGLWGDRVSLGFLAETEHQVERHLYKHLQKLPLQDKKSRIIVEQMRKEELEHALTAEYAGAIPLPIVIQWSMQGLAKFMSIIAYRI